MNGLLAALMFFTRLPIHRVRRVPTESFRHVTGWWSITGWLTGGVSALTCWLMTELTTPAIAIVAALLVRAVLTGALHEDGLADFLDGMGGGNDRDSRLRIMKDSHIGTYGVIGLVMYFLLSFAILSSVRLSYVPIVIMTSDVFSKCVCSHIVWLLPYARQESESKSRTVYSLPTPLEETLTILSGITALLLLTVTCHSSTVHWFIFSVVQLSAIIVFVLLVLLCKRRIGGYTGDCCGALCLITELVFRFLTAVF